MGERQGWLFECSYSRSVKLRQADPRVTSNGGAILLREIDHRLGLTADLAAALLDPRLPAACRYSQTGLLRQPLYSPALGYVHGDDADTLAHDAARRLAVSGRPGRPVADRRRASQPSD